MCWWVLLKTKVPCCVEWPWLLVPKHSHGAVHGPDAWLRLNSVWLATQGHVAAAQGQALHIATAACASHA